MIRNADQVRIVGQGIQPGADFDVTRAIVIVNSESAIAAPILSDRPELKEPIYELANKIRTARPKEEDDSFSDLTRFFILVESELSRLGTLRGFPPFYRRAASFAQGSLIQRQINFVGVDPAGFRKWIDHHFGGQFFAQTLADMRVAPQRREDHRRAEGAKGCREGG